jgi:hypothetical protein
LQEIRVSQVKALALTGGTMVPIKKGFLPTLPEKNAGTKINIEVDF